MKNQADILKRFQPFLIYALARDDAGRGLTADQIALRSGMSKRNVVRVSQMLNWDAVKAKTIEDFMRGCNFKTPQKQVDYMRKTAKSAKKFSHLSKLRLRSFEERIAAWQKLQSENKI